jgi:hypothetical protein
MMFLSLAEFSIALQDFPSLGIGMKRYKCTAQRKENRMALRRLHVGRIRVKLSSINDMTHDDRSRRG